MCRLHDRILSEAPPLRSLEISAVQLLFVIHTNSTSVILEVVPFLIVRGSSVGHHVVDLVKYSVGVVKIRIFVVLEDIEAEATFFHFRDCAVFIDDIFELLFGSFFNLEHLQNAYRFACPGARSMKS